MCNMVGSKEEVTLRNPSREEIDQITANMVAQVQTRSMVQGKERNKVAIIFIKGTDHKKGEIVKPKESPTVKVKFANNKWEPRKGRNPEDIESSNNISKKRDGKIPQNVTEPDKSHHNPLNTLGKHDEKGNVNKDNLSDSSIDMFTILSQINIKVPLFELLRIPEHQDKAIAWLGSTDVKVTQECNENHVPKEVKKEKVKEQETKVVVSQIPHMFLDNSVNECLRNVEPFFLKYPSEWKDIKELYD